MIGPALFNALIELEMDGSKGSRSQEHVRLGTCSIALCLFVSQRIGLNMVKLNLRDFRRGSDAKASLEIV